MKRFAYYFNHQVDVFAFGVSAFFILFKTYPFSIPSRTPKSWTQIMTWVKVSNMKYKIPVDADKITLDFILQLIAEMPVDRPTIADILTHPFFFKSDRIGVFNLKGFLKKGRRDWMLGKV
ncbi:MAG: serine/threonine protein kinase [Litorivivens sp.]